MCSFCCAVGQTWLRGSEVRLLCSTLSSYTAISSPRQSGVPCLLRTFSSLTVSSSLPQPKISISSSSSPSSSSSLSSLSSVFDSYSEAIPDSRNLAKSRKPRELTSRDNSFVVPSETSGLLISSLLAFRGGGGEGSRGGGGPGGPGRKRKHSSLSKHWSLPRGLPKVPLEDEKTLPVPSLVPRACRFSADSSGFGVVGSQITGGTVERKVISNKLSWDPTGERTEKGFFKVLFTPSKRSQADTAVINFCCGRIMISDHRSSQIIIKYITLTYKSMQRQKNCCETHVCVLC